MALLSELVATCEAQRLDKGPTLSMFARRLREAGRITQAGRGRGAAHMTFLDAARFLIACAATDSPEQAVDAEHVFSNLLPYGGTADADYSLDFPTLDLALEKVLQNLADGSIEATDRERWEAEHSGVPMIAAPLTFRLARSHVTAFLDVLRGRYVFHHPALMDVVGSLENGNPSARKVAEQALERETYRFRTGKNLTAELDGKLLRTVAKLIAGGAE